jgi:nucleotide-binding universal stress UspA family protein
MYRIVVVGTDGSSTADKAVEAAANLSRSWGSTLHVVTGYKSGSRGMANVAGAPLVDSGAEGALREEAARQVGQKAIESWCAGVDAQDHAVAGDAADAILDTSRSLGADLIIVGSKGMRGARRFLGSVPNSVCHGAECSVLVIKTD